MTKKKMQDSRSDSDASWEPEPYEECDGKASLSSPSLSESDDDMPFVHGTGPQYSHHTHHNYELPSLGVIPMQAPLEPHCIDTVEKFTGPEASSKRKRRKPGILGNKVPNSLNHSSSRFQLHVLQDPKKAREAQAQKWSSEGGSQVPTSHETEALELASNQEASYET